MTKTWKYFLSLLLSVLLCSQYAIASGGSVDPSTNTIKSYMTVTDSTYTRMTAQTADTLPPVTSILLEGNGPGAGVYYGPVQVTLSATDDISGVQYTEYSTDGGATWSQYMAPVTLVDAKVYSFKYKSVDHSGNAEAAKTTKITIKTDSLPPATTVQLSGTIGSNGYYVCNVQVLLSAKDDYAGVGRTEYSLDNGLNWILYENPFTLEGNGIHRVSYRSIDNNGNTEAYKTQKIFIDQIAPPPPQLTAAPAGWTNGDVKVTVISSLDIGSGSMKSQYKIGISGNWTDYSIPFYVSGVSETKVYARTIDFAGNTGEAAEYTVQIDKIPPHSPEIILSQFEWTYLDVYATIVNGSDADSGTLHSEYKLAQDWSLYNYPLVFKEEGVTTIFGRSLDRAGNYSPEVSATVKIDRTKPTSPGLILSTEEWTNQDVQLTVTHGLDELSGVKKSEVSTNPTGDPVFQEYTGSVVLNHTMPFYVYGRTIDHAGNISEPSSVLVKLDKIPPTKPVLEASSTEWTNNDVIVAIVSGTDEHSGAKEVQFKINDSQQWMVYGEPITIVKEGIHTIYARTVDYAGNDSGTSTINVKIDRTPPQAPEHAYIASKTVSSVVLVWSPATDSASGVKSYDIYNGEALVGSTDKTSFNIVGLAPNTAHYLTVKAKDAAGNSSAASPAVRTVLTDPIVSAFRSSFAVKTNGTAWAWGENNAGELGNRSFMDAGIPVATLLQDYVTISAGAEYAMGIKDDGSVWAWGTAIPGSLNGTGSDAWVEPVPVPNLNSITSIAAGLVHRLALKEDGTIWAWGSNSFGELGLGDDSVPSIHYVEAPVKVPLMESVVAVSASYYHSLALKSDGTVWSWGGNGNGQLGDGTLVDKHHPVQVTGLSSVIAISAGPYLNLALKMDGTVWVWGNDNLGPIGDGREGGSLVPVQVAGIDGVVSVKAGDAYGMALKNDGTVWTWGWNASGALGDGTTRTALTPVQVSHLGGVAEISAGEGFALAVKENGTIWIWGSNWNGSLGNGSGDGYRSTTRLRLNGIPGGPADAAAPSAPELSVAGKASNSAVLEWSEAMDDFAVEGYEIYQDGVWIGSTSIASTSSALARSFTATGLLAEATYTFTVRARDGSGHVSEPSNVVSATTEISLPKSISAGEKTSLILKSDGTVWYYGDSYFSTLIQVPGLHSIVAISQGSQHALALRSDGTVWAWGLSSSGQLGIPDTYYTDIPLQVPGLSQVVEVVAAETHSLALKSDGTVWAWGDNYAGKLGLGDPELYVQLTPAQIPGLFDVKAISANLFNSLALKQDGTVWSWGVNFYGQVGDGTDIDRYSPVRITNLNGITAIASGMYHSLVVGSDGSVWSWGANFNGQLGDGTTENRFSPVRIAGIQDPIQSVSAGGVHNLALSASGNIWSWGDNFIGQLGDGTLTQRLSPVRVTALNDQHAVDAGSYHSLSLGEDGTVWSWGANDNYQLGDGTRYYRQTPVRMLGLGMQQSRSSSGEASVPSDPPRSAAEMDSYIRQLEAHKPNIPTRDIFAPEAPIIAGVEKQAGGSYTLTWSRPEDNEGVTGYVLLVDNQVLGEITGMEWSFDSLPEGIHIVTVKAKDAAGNESIPSRAVVIGN